MSISCHIMPLVINSLGGAHTHKHTHTHTYRHPHRNNFKKPGECDQCASGLTSIDSTVCHLLSMMQASLEAVWQHARHLYRPLIGMCNLGYLSVCSRIPERKSYDPTQNNGVEQHGEQSGSPLASIRILKKAERHI